MKYKHFWQHKIEGGTKRTHVFEMGATSERYVEMLRNFLRPQLRSLRG
jgi:hypothetical protein